jgi:hypothetical protein
MDLNSYVGYKCKWMCIFGTKMQSHIIAFDLTKDTHNNMVYKVRNESGSDRIG